MMQDYSALYRTLSEPVWVIDQLTTKFLDANGHAVKQLGFDLGEIKSFRVSDINKTLPTMADWHKLTDGMRVGDSALCSAELVCKTGGLVSVEITLSRQYINGGDVFLAITRTQNQAHH